MKSILDPSFKYTPSTNTDIAKTFARIRRMQRQEAMGATSRGVESSGNVSVFQRPRGTDSKVA
jgi:hypothetical protein